MTEFERFTRVCRSLLRLREIKLIEVFDTVPFRVRVTLDFGILNSFVQRQLEQAESILAHRYDASFVVIPFEGNYITRFPLQTKEARLAGSPSVVPTVVAYPE